MDRERFHFPRRHYFMSHSVGAQPRDWASACEHGFIAPWRNDGLAVWDKWFEVLDRFKAGLAPIIGAQANDICPQTNVSSGISKLLLSLPDRPGRKKIVLTEDDFPTVGFALGAAKRFGYELVFLPGGPRLADPDSWLPAFRDDVQLVVATQIYSNTSVRAPCAEIAQRARNAGVYTVIDAAQSAGTLPVQLDAWAPDFAVGTSLKYLCGATGAAWLWINRATADSTEPFDVGWFSHADPYEFDIKHFEYAEGAARYTGGTPSIAPFAGACAAHEILNAHGIDVIYRYNQRLLDRLIAALPADAFLSSTQSGQRGSSALIKVRDYEAAERDLADADIAHDTRKGAVRISVHLYNDEQDIDALVDVLSKHI